MPGITYNQREIVLVPFPYSDLTTTKRRPVLIISNNDYNRDFQDVLVCVITSNQFKDDYSVELLETDLELGILAEPSIVKAHKLFTIHQSKIIKKFSLIKESHFIKVISKLKQLIDDPSSLPF